MKKPNITEGEWFQKAEDVETENGDLIARSYRYVESREDLANAQAISAVPEMLDALIEACKYLKRVEMLLEPEHQDVIDDIEQALGKAGCDL